MALQYDLATGLGSVNVNNLVSQWNSVTFPATKTTFSISPVTGTHGAPLNLTIDVSALNLPGTPGGYVWLQGGSSRGNLVGDSTKATFQLDSSGSVSATTHILPGGSIFGERPLRGRWILCPSDSDPPIAVNIQPENSITTLSIFSRDAGGILVPFTSGSYGTPLYFKAHVAGLSGYGMPTSWVSFTDNHGAGIFNVPLDGSGDALSPALSQWGTGAHSIIASYQGDFSFDSSTSAPTGITIIKATTTTTLQSSSPTIPSGGQATLTATIDTTSNGNFPSGTVLFFNNGSQLPGGAHLPMVN